MIFKFITSGMDYQSPIECEVCNDSKKLGQFTFCTQCNKPTCNECRGNMEKKQCPYCRKEFKCEDMDKYTKNKLTNMSFLEIFTSSELYDRVDMSVVLSFIQSNMFTSHLAMYDSVTFISKMKTNLKGLIDDKYDSTYDEDDNEKMNKYLDEFINECMLMIS